MPPHAAPAVPTIRPMTAADLPHTKHVFRESLRALLAEVGRDPALLDGMCPLPTAEAHHLLATDPSHHWVAEVRGTVVGYVSAVTRGPIWFLAGFWMLPEFQGARIGQQLLARARDAGVQRDARVWCVYSAVTERAQALYIRMGMTPRTPLYTLALPLARVDAALEALTLRGAPALDIAAMSASTAPLQALSSIDFTVRGVARSEDHRYWLARPTRTCLVAFAGNKPVGYAYATDGGRIGPVATLDPRAMPPLLAAAVRSAAAQLCARRAAEARPAAPDAPPVADDDEILLTLPGVSMEALRLLLDLGFHIRHHGIFMSNEEFGQLDRYVISGAGLL